MVPFSVRTPEPFSASTGILTTSDEPLTKFNYSVLTYFVFDCTYLSPVSSISKRISQRLQLIQKHITPVRAVLRINFNILLLVFKAFSGQAPAYIHDLSSPYEPDASTAWRISGRQTVPSFKCPLEKSLLLYCLVLAVAFLTPLIDLMLFYGM